MANRQQILDKFESKKNQKLIFAVILDLMGVATYLLPVLGEGFDVVFAPFYAIAIAIIFRQRPIIGTVAGVGGGIEELLPGTDIIPSALIAWFLTYRLSEDKTLNNFIAKEENRLNRK